MLFIPLNVNWYRMPFSRAVDLDPHESTFIFPPPFHFMTCLDGEFYGEKDEQRKTNIQHKINIKNWPFSLIIVWLLFFHHSNPSDPDLVTKCAFLIISSFCRLSVLPGLPVGHPCWLEQEVPADQVLLGPALGHSRHHDLRAFYGPLPAQPDTRLQYGHQHAQLR